VRVQRRFASIPAIVFQGGLYMRAYAMRSASNDGWHPLQKRAAVRRCIYAPALSDITQRTWSKLHDFSAGVTYVRALVVRRGTQAKDCLGNEAEPVNGAHAVAATDRLTFRTAGPARDPARRS
jgi:hypothetical protein